MLAEMKPGQIVRVLATDPGSVKDFQAFAKQTGNELLDQRETPDQAFEFFLRRK
jgi:tRNA 2-thiouridine synthesizing protein A